MSLSEIFTKRPDLLDDERKLKSTFSDYYAGDEPQIRRMMKAYEVGTLAAILSGKTDELERNKLIDKLVNLHDMQEAKARAAVSEWCAFCTPAVVRALKQYQSTKKTAEIAAKKAAEDRKRAAEKAAKQAAEEEKKAAARAEREEQEQRETIAAKAASNINVDHDEYNRYLNVDLGKRKELVKGIPCGVGNSDFGFRIIGAGRTFSNINSYDEELYPSLLALVYNFLVRNTHITKDSYPQYMRSHSFNHELDYGHVYRFIMILLELVNPVGETKLRLNIIGDRQEFSAAVDILNEYLAVFGRLIKTEPCFISYVDDPSGRSISVESPADLCVENYTEDQGLHRRLRYGQRINYSLGKEDRADLEFLLREISSFKHFKRGQFDALCSMLNANGHAVCIMPTGSGKSLIYYFACLLQPQVVFVVSPTDILIRDQIRNLKKFHHFDNATHLMLRADNDFDFYRPGTSLVFLTPSTFQNRNLFGIFKRHAKRIAYVVLDEIHCLSNWGHDFRPEYLMLSKNMEQYLENVRYLGFTATANYTVAQDIQKQLNIPLENFFSPVHFEKYNVRYDFREAGTTDDMLSEVKSVASEIVRKNGRAIVFTKSDEISQKVADAIGYEADVFTEDQPDAYNQFVEGLCRILVASEDLGIGINLPNVTCTVHFGMPVSKNEFVQEIGRAGRADEKVTAYVIYLKPSEKNIPSQLLKRDTVIDNLPQLLGAMNNDYSDIYHRLNCGADTSDVLYDRLVDVYSDFHTGQKLVYVIDHPVDTIETYKQYLYMLYVTGYINDWYTYRALGNDKITIIVDICFAPTHGGHGMLALEDWGMLERMKKTSREYFASMGNDRESIYNVSRAKTHEDVLQVYVKWYYEKFLYHHKEQFLDFFEFLTGNVECNSLKITEEIEDYFTLPFVQIKEDEDYYSNMSFKEISNQLVTGIGKNTLANLERINSNSYSYKLDYLLFLGNWSRLGRFDVNRLERFWGKMSADERRLFEDTLAALYPDCQKEAKWNCLKYLDDRNNITGIRLQKAVDIFYAKARKDDIYYGILAASLNRKFGQFIRRH